MIVVLVTSVIREGYLERFLRECEELRPHILAEKGCLGYCHGLDHATDMRGLETPNPHRVTLVETWASLDAFERHRTNPRGKEFGSKVEDMRESRSLRVLAIVNQQISTLNRKEEK